MATTTSSSSSSLMSKSNRAMASTSFASRRSEALSDHDSQSSVTYYELPSNHFLAQPGGQPSSSSWSTKGDRLSFSASYSDGKHAKTETQSSGSLSAEDRHQLSYIPDHISQGFHNSNALPLGGQQVRAHMPDVSTLAAADFDVDVRLDLLINEDEEEEVVVAICISTS